jgi:meso-butanediol dehydrogenase/(S,S)-butanediol dehydrogenase/diacetyl reductase
MSRLEGRVAIVTGGAMGIGRGIALELAHEGADIVVGDIDLPKAEESASEVRAVGRRVTAVELDVTDVESIDAFLTNAARENERIDILVNNAGVVGEHVGGASITEQDWDHCYAVNLKGMWLMSRALVPHFKEQGGGKIVNISSIAGRRGGAGLAPYSASKAGAISLTQSMARELGPSNINVNAVCPGLLWTAMWRRLEGMIGGDRSPDVVEQRAHFEQIIRSNCPLGREQTPEDIGKAVAFLASDDANNITGQALNVDGGIELN